MVPSKCLSRPLALTSGQPGRLCLLVHSTCSLLVVLTTRMHPGRSAPLRKRRQRAVVMEQVASLQSVAGVRFRSHQRGDCVWDGPRSSAGGVPHWIEVQAAVTRSNLRRRPCHHFVSCVCFMLTFKNNQCLKFLCVKGGLAGRPPFAGGVHAGQCSEATPRSVSSTLTCIVHEPLRPPRSQSLSTVPVI